MDNSDYPKTYEEARRIGVYRDWYSILLTVLDERIRHIAISLLKKGVSVENVYETTGLPKEERKLKNASYWERICAAVDDKNTAMAVCFRGIANERVCEITKKLLRKRTYIGVSVDGISEATGLPKERVEQLYETRFTSAEIAKLMTDEYERQHEQSKFV